VVWFPFVFALGYWVTSWFSITPGSGETIASQGLVGWLTNLGYALVVGLPAWAGAWWAYTARRLGGRTGAAVALVLNLLVGTGLLVLCLVEPL
jgi:hypothetical protein